MSCTAGAIQPGSTSASVNDHVKRRLMEFAQRTRALRSDGGASVFAE
jgi:hypothetical protein